MQKVKTTFQQARPSFQDASPPALGKLFFTPRDSDFGAFVLESLDFWAGCPEIRLAVEADLRADALARKHLRERDRQFFLARTPMLPWEKEEVSSEPSACALELLTGRPRMAAELVFLMTMIRGWFSSVCSREAVDFLRESSTLEWVLQERGWKLPAPTTILENINALSEATLALIHRMQLRRAIDEGLEDFGDLCADSTAVDASSAWPTDSSMIEGLAGRAWRLGGKLGNWGVQGFGGELPVRWLQEIGRLDFEIDQLGGKAGGKRQRRKAYNHLFLTACKIGENLFGQLGRSLGAFEAVKADMPPSRREACEALLEHIREDLIALSLTIAQSQKRIEEEICAKTSERILSLADRSAAMIVKGGREPHLGYKAQLVRTGQGGLVSAVLVDPGNPSDSAMLRPLITRSVEQSGVVPRSVSFDDGYTSSKNLRELLEMGVETVSFSGAKGKRLLGEELWERPVYRQLRCDRSAVESLMFVLKHRFDFGRMGRRGIEAVRCEMLEKVLAYNASRMVLLRGRAQAPPGAEAA